MAVKSYGYNAVLIKRVQNSMDANIVVKGNTLPYVSRGGLKLEKGYSNVSYRFTDAVMVDIGASTGGFTDCALQNGAAKVFAIDVGYNQLAWKLRQDPCYQHGKAKYSHCHTRTIR